MLFSFYTTSYAHGNIIDINSSTEFLSTPSPTVILLRACALAQTPFKIFIGRAELQISRIGADTVDENSGPITNITNINP